MMTDLLTVTCPPLKAGTRARRMTEAMQPPVAVPAKGGPLTLALVARPEGAKVTTTTARPLGSPGRRQPEACAAALPSADRAAAVLKGPEPALVLGWLVLLVLLLVLLSVVLGVGAAVLALIALASLLDVVDLEPSVSFWADSPGASAATSAEALGGASGAPLLVALATGASAEASALGSGDALFRLVALATWAVASPASGVD